MSNLLSGYHQDRLFDQLQSNIITEAEYQLFAMLKPSIAKDGDQWCVLYGENIQVGICGFGKTPYLAILDFNKAFNKN